jgi:hypothetical protein
MKQSKWGVIGRGKVGWHAAGMTEYHSYGSSTASSSRGSLDEYLKHAIDGCLVYDAENANYDQFVDLIIKGPLVDPNLAAEEHSALDREAAQRILPGLGGAYVPLTKLALAGFTSLDKVGVKVYACLLRNVPGVKVGWVREGKIEWET